MSGDDERQTCTTTNPGSILQVRRMEAPYINQSKWVDYATLEASRILEIARYIENDNLADIKLKLTCANSIAAMNIYMEQMKYHRATEQRAMDCSVKMRRSFFNRIQIVSNPFEARELATRWMDGWMNSNSWREVNNTSAR